MYILAKLQFYMTIMLTALNELSLSPSMELFSGMGMTLTLDDLRSALLMPKELAAGFVLQYTVCVQGQN